jgi:hypothetical protein
MRWILLLLLLCTLLLVLSDTAAAKKGGSAMQPPTPPRAPQPPVAAEPAGALPLRPSLTFESCPCPQGKAKRPAAASRRAIAGPRPPGRRARAGWMCCRLHAHRPCPSCRRASRTTRTTRDTCAALSAGCRLPPSHCSQLGRSVPKLPHSDHISVLWARAQMWEKARALLESCPAARALGEPCAEAEEAEGVWRILAELLEPSHVDVGFNLALSLERFDQYYDATQVWEAVIMANPDAHSRASKECSKVLSLIAREMGVPGAGSEHPDPDVEQRRQRERAEQGVSADPGNVGGGLGEAQSEMRHLQDDALAIQEEAKRLMLTDDCAGENGYHAVVACHSRAVALLGLLVFVVPNHGAAIGQLAEALALSGRPADAFQLLNRVRKTRPFCVPFYTENPNVCQDRLGTIHRKSGERRRFGRWRSARRLECSGWIGSMRRGKLRTRRAEGCF